MAVNGYALNTTGTPLSWKSTGGDFAITLASLGSGAARQGAKGDLGAFWARRWAVYFTTAMVSAAVNGQGVEVYWCPSPNATAGLENPGGASGADAVLATPAEFKQQLISIGSLALSNAAGTAIQVEVFEFYPPTRYGMPVIFNGSSVALGATAGNHEFRIVPILEVSATTAGG